MPSLLSGAMACVPEFVHSWLFRFYNVNMAARLKENNKNGIFDASHWKPLESGLMGPVTITPLNNR